MPRTPEQYWRLLQDALIPYGLSVMVEHPYTTHDSFGGNVVVIGVAPIPEYKGGVLAVFERGFTLTTKTDYPLLFLDASTERIESQIKKLAQQTALGWFSGRIQSLILTANETLTPRHGRTLHLKSITFAERGAVWMQLEIEAMNEVIAESSIVRPCKEWVDPHQDTVLVEWLIGGALKP